MDFEAALEWHRDQLGTAASKTVTYRRGEFEADISVTYGSRNAAEEYHANTIRVGTQIRDFIIAPENLILDGTVTAPMSGDTVEVVDGTTTLTYRVLPLSEGPAWEWDNDYRKLMVLHTKLICEEQE